MTIFVILFAFSALDEGDIEILKTYVSFILSIYRLVTKILNSSPSIFVSHAQFDRKMKESKLNLLWDQGAFRVRPTPKIRREFRSSTPSGRRSALARKMLCRPSVGSNSYIGGEILDVFGQNQFV